MALEFEVFRRSKYVLVAMAVGLPGTKLILSTPRFPYPNRALQNTTQLVASASQSSPKTYLLVLGIVVSGVPLLSLLRRGRNLSGRLSECLARGLRRHCDSPGWLTWGWVKRGSEVGGVEVV